VPGGALRNRGRLNKSVVVHADHLVPSSVRRHVATRRTDDDDATLPWISVAILELIHVPDAPRRRSTGTERAFAVRAASAPSPNGGDVGRPRRFRKHGDRADRAPASVAAVRPPRQTGGRTGGGGATRRPNVCPINFRRQDRGLPW